MRGQQAAKYYRQIAEQQQNSDARQQVLERGLSAGLRDGDLESATWFQSKLTGNKAVRGVVDAATVTVPGGLDALGFVAHSKNSSPELFLVEYARAVAKSLYTTNKKAAAMFAASIKDHFERIAELSALGEASNGRVTVTISAQEKNGQKKTEKVLELLGWKIRTSKAGVKLEAAEKGERAGHHDTASALAIDEVGMQQALESGKPFSFEILNEPAIVILGEDPWRTQFYAKEKFSGGIAEAIADNLELARIYAALGQMDPSTASLLVSGIGLKTLTEKYAALLYEYSSALAMDKGRVTIPGGDAAAAVWTGLTGANPAQPAAFFRALLQKDGGRFARLLLGHERARHTTSTLLHAEPGARGQVLFVVQGCP